MPTAIFSDNCALCFVRPGEYVRARRTGWHFAGHGLATNCPMGRGKFSRGGRVFLGGCYSQNTGEIELTSSMTMVQESQAKVSCRNPVFLGRPAVIASEPMLRLMGTIERVA